MLKKLCLAVLISFMTCTLTYGQVQLQHESGNSSDVFHAGEKVRLTVQTTPPWHEIGQLTSIIAYFNPKAGSQGEMNWVQCRPALTSNGALTCETQVPGLVVTGTYLPGDIRLYFGDALVVKQADKSEELKFEGVSAEEWQPIKNTQYGVKLSK